MNQIELRIPRYDGKQYAPLMERLTRAGFALHRGEEMPENDKPAPEPGLVVITTGAYEARHAYPTATWWAVEGSNLVIYEDENGDVELGEYAPGAWAAVRREPKEH